MKGIDQHWRLERTEKMVFWLILFSVIGYLGLGYLIFSAATTLGVKGWVVIGVLLLAGGAGLLLVMARMNRGD